MKQFDIRDRLGNQLFQFAHIYSEIVKNPEEYSVNVCPIDIDRLEYKPKIEKGNIFLGYNEGEQYFDPDVIRKIYTPTTKQKNAIKKKYGDLSNSLFIHVRRGDFVNLCDSFVTLNGQYYEDMYNILTVENNYSSIIIASDNFLWCKDNIHLPREVIYLEEESPIDTIFIAACCKDFIIGASTFSWWCAWLGEANGGKVICPNEKFKAINGEYKYPQIWNKKGVWPEAWVKKFFLDRWQQVDARKYYENLGQGVALCAIAKMENHYIREWVEHYKSLKFNKIFLVDNNDVNGERFEEVIDDYIKSGFVQLINFRGKKQCQQEAYNYCYNTYGYLFDWMAFFDIDEFLEIDTFPFKRNIKTFLNQKRFDPFIAVKVGWKLMTDSDIIRTNGNYSVKKFTEFLDKYKAQELKQHYGKSIVRTRQKIKFDWSVHMPSGVDKKICNVFGKPESIGSNFMKELIWVRAWLLHYRFKTIEEYITNKTQRLYPDHDDEYSKKVLSLDYFWRINKKTPEKEAYAKEILKQFK